jgi:fructose-bisphosphate aldolase class II
MFDGSTMPLEDNISITKKIVEAAKAVGVSVEAELGQVGRTEDEILEEDWEKFLTDPDVAATFVQETKVDALAVSIGSLHGLYRFEPKLDFSRLKRIRELIEVPIVLHGGTGIPDLDIKKAISLGIRKVNFSTGLRAAYIGQLRDFLIENRDELNLQRVLGSARQKMKEVVKEMIRLVGSDGKADISTSERSIFETA